MSLSSNYKETSKYGLYSALFAVGAFLLRIIGIRDCLSTTGAVPYSVDPAYHLRRARLLVEDFPSIRFFDQFISYPEGANIVWPPGFDFLIALPALLGFGTNSIGFWGALLPPLLGALAVWLTYKLGAAIFNPQIGLLAAALLAIFPASILVTVVGRVDHHAIVAPVVLLSYLMFIYCIETENRRMGVLYGVLSGIIAGLGVQFWIVTPPLYFFPIPATILILSLIKPNRNLKIAGLTVIPAALIVVLISVLLTSNYREVPFDLYEPSLFTIIPYLLAAFIVIPFTFGKKAGLISFFITSTAFLYSFQYFSQPLIEALSVFFKNSKPYLMAQESRSILFDGDGFNFGPAVSYFSYLFLLTPLMIAGFAIISAKSSTRQVSNLLFLIYLIIAFSLTLLQARFKEFSAPAIALIFAWIGITGGTEVLNHLRKNAEGLRGKILGAILASTVLIAFSPVIMTTVEFSQIDHFFYPKKLKEFSAFIGKVSEEEIVINQGLPHGILASWADSHLLLLYTGRPIITSSFGSQTATEGNQVAFRMFFSDNEDSVYHYLSRVGIKYIVVSTIFQEIEAMTGIAGIPQHFLDIEKDEKNRTAYIIKNAFIETFHTRLYFGDGSITEVGTFQTAPLQHFALLAESDEYMKIYNIEMPMFKAFKVVDGARIQGIAEPNTKVEISLPLKTNGHRKFVYRNFGITDNEGRFSITTPYSSELEKGPTSAIGPYTIRVERKQKTFHVSAANVNLAQTVEIDFDQ
jgi:dolichyl-phosphooligosaccharide-protein glycotransferase